MPSMPGTLLPQRLPLTFALRLRGTLSLTLSLSKFGYTTNQLFRKE